MEIKTSSVLKDRAVSIRCSWAAGYAQPVHDKGQRCISFTKRYDINKPDQPDKLLFGKSTEIARTTGRFVEDENGHLWVEAASPYCDRVPLIWFKNHSINPYFPEIKEDVKEEDDNKSKSKTLIWLAAAAALLFS